MEASKINVKVSAGGENRDRKQPARLRTRPPTMDEVLGWIHSLSLDPTIEKELIKKAQKYPLEAMYRFREKIARHVREIQRNLLERNYSNDDEDES